jgi:glycosyltransferase involved in cell wall biosynthesis
VTQPRFSVIVPAHDAAPTLGRCLAAVEDNGVARPDLEIIVVDDASSDGTSAVAAQYADALIRLPDVARGPAYARNRGAEAAHGAILLFVDADVVLPPGSLSRLARAFDERPATAAVIGRYSVDVAESTLPSAYRDARWHYLHGPTAGPVATFWGACGAIRTGAFEEVGRFNDWHFSAPPAEDVELGRRLAARGLRVELLPELEVRHLHECSLRQLLARDCWQRGLRVARLLGDATLRPRPAESSRARHLPVELLLLAIVTTAALATLVAGRPLPLLLAAMAALLLAIQLPFLSHLARTLGVVRAVAVLPLHLTCELVTASGIVSGWALGHLIGAPRPHPTVEALAEVGVRTWPPLPTRR